jgi:hypothetical protein
MKVVAQKVPHALDEIGIVSPNIHIGRERELSSRLDRQTFLVRGNHAVHVRLASIQHVPAPRIRSQFRFHLRSVIDVM